MIDLQRLRPEDALSFFRSKGLAPPDARFDFRDVWRNEHASNFVVAKAMRTDVLETIRGALDRALANGGTLSSFMGLPKCVLRCFWLFCLCVLRCFSYQKMPRCFGCFCYV